MLRQRSAWNHAGPRLQRDDVPKIGEVVLVEDNMRPRNLWTVARILELQGKGAVRNAKLAMPNGRVLSRPINRLYPLEVNRTMESEPPSTIAVPAPSEQDAVSTANEIATPHIEPDITHINIAETPITVDDAPAPTDDLIPAPVRRPRGRPRRPVNPTPPTHQMNTRGKASAIAAIAATLICVMLLPTTLATKCGASCENSGIRLDISPDVQKILICCDGMNCFHAPNTSQLDYAVPDNLLRTNFTCDLSCWTESANHTHDFPSTGVNCSANTEQPTPNSGTTWRWLLTIALVPVIIILIVVGCKRWKRCGTREAPRCCGMLRRRQTHAPLKRQRTRPKADTTPTIQATAPSTSTGITHPIGSIFTISPSTSNPVDFNAAWSDIPLQEMPKAKTGFIGIARSTIAGLGLVMMLMQTDANAKSTPSIEACNGCHISCATTGIVVEMPEIIEKFEICCHGDICYTHAQKSTTRFPMNSSSTITGVTYRSGIRTTRCSAPPYNALGWTSAYSYVATYAWNYL